MLDRWTQADRDAILDVIRDDLTVAEQLEIASFDDKTFAGFAARFFTAVLAEFDLA